MSRIRILTARDTDYFQSLIDILFDFDRIETRPTELKFVDDATGLTLAITGTGFKFGSGGVVSGGLATGALISDANGSIAGIDQFSLSLVTLVDTLIRGTEDEIADLFGDISFVGGRGDDTGLSLFGKDSLAGNGGDDFLEAGPGKDTLLGGAGNDTLVGGAGGDRLDGGANTRKGYDFVSYEDGLALGASLASPHANTGYATGDRYVGIEGIIGSALDDILSGDGKNNYLVGWLGDDRLLGAGGNDILQGDDGFDNLGGGQGSDTMIGGAGVDRFEFFEPEAGLARPDIINDFELGVDRILLFRDGFGLKGTQLTRGNYFIEKGPADPDYDKSYLLYDQDDQTVSWFANGSLTTDPIVLFKISNDLDGNLRSFDFGII